MTKLDRVTADISKASEYFSARELQASTGQPVYRFADVILKELVDNGLDAAEKAGRPPEISIIIRKGPEKVQITVQDNGNGIDADIVKRVMDFGVRVSDKVIYRSPSRGQQGNALKTVLGMPHALDSPEPVIIESRGLRHTIYSTLDPLGNPSIEHAIEHIDTVEGTRITIVLPIYPAAQMFDPIAWARRFALVNPHALVKIQVFDENGLDSLEDNSESHKLQEIYQPSALASWRKFMPNDLTAPSWYDVDTLKQQVFAHIRSEIEDQPLRKYVKSFRGLSANDKAKLVCDRLPVISHLSDFEKQSGSIAELLEIMNDVAEPPSPTIMGYIGKDSIRQGFDELYGVKEDRFWYKRLIYDHHGIPYIIEAVAAEVKVDKGAVIHALNFSPTFDDPLSNTLLESEKVTANGIHGFTEDCYGNYASANPNSKQNIVWLLHIVSPGLTFFDRGKTSLSLPDPVTSLVGQALWSVGKELYVEGKRREKNSAKEAKREYERSHPQKKKGDLRDAVF